jgi:thymidylate synthase (FAD)
MKISEMSVVLRKVDGTELDIVNAARVSFHKESFFEKNGKFGGTDLDLAERDVKLITYLAKHGHWTPFGHVNATFVFKAPIFVARQLGKHQVGLVWNEVSRRYVDEEPEFFIPTTLRSRPDSSIKQGSGKKVIPLVTEHGRHPYMDLSSACETAFQTYRNLLNDGVAPEQARMVLPQNMMTEWWWTGSLAAWARVFNLRLDPHTQQETRDVVQLAYDQLVPHFPNALKALVHV